jgi:hypothetical protein
MGMATQHVRQECTDPDCTGNCNLCNLFMCKVCKGAEGSLPTDCPGRKLTDAEEDAIMAGRLDFKNGEWARPAQGRDTQMDRLPEEGTTVLAWWDLGENEAPMLLRHFAASGWEQWDYESCCWERGPAQPPTFWVSLAQAKAAPQMAAALRGIGRCGVCETCSAAARAASRPAPDVDAAAAVIREAIEKGRGEGSPPS